jgi:hypothetical protein
MVGTVGRSGLPAIPGAEDMMSEMARRLRERRAKAEGGITNVKLINVLLFL